MKSLLLLPIIALFTSCSGSGDSGGWTPADTKAAIGAVNDGYQLYDRYNNPAAYRPIYGPTVLAP